MAQADAGSVPADCAGFESPAQVPAPRHRILRAPIVVGQPSPGMLYHQGVSTLDAAVYLVETWLVSGLLMESRVLGPELEPMMGRPPE